MAKQAKDWNPGDKFVFTESPFPSGPIPTKVFTLGERRSNPKDEFQYFDVPYKLGDVIVAAAWIKEVDDE